MKVKDLIFFLEHIEPEMLVVKEQFDGNGASDGYVEYGDPGTIRICKSGPLQGGDFTSARSDKKGAFIALEI